MQMLPVPSVGTVAKEIPKEMTDIGCDKITWIYAPKYVHNIKCKHITYT